MGLRLFGADQDRGGDRAFIHSLEGGIYLIEVETRGVSKFVEDVNSRAPRSFRSLHQAKEYARSMNITNIDLALDTPFDQMIGLASCS